MAYPFLPVNPCCTDVVLNTPCGCSSTITNSGCNNNNPCSTHLTASSTIVYDGPVLPCIVAEPCDTLNVILQKIDEIICNLLTQINYLTNQVTNITNQIIIINGDIINIYNILDECCGATTTTTSTTTAAPCESFSLDNTGPDPVAIIITDCITGEQEAIVLLPGATDICVETDSPLTVPGTVIVTPNGPCGPTTTTTTSSSSTTTTTTTVSPCECLTFYNDSVSSQEITYIDCNGEPQYNIILPYATNSYCGCCGEAPGSPDVSITIGANCINGLCPAEPTTTTTTTESLCDCYDTEITILSETLAATDNNQLTVLYNDCFTNPYIDTFNRPGVYPLGCVNYLVGIAALGEVDGIEQAFYVPITTGSPCCDETTTTTTSTSSTTTTTTTLPCNCVDVIISQDDLDDATGNTLPFFDGKVNLFPDKDITCENGSTDAYYSVAGTYTYCLKGDLIPTIILQYVKDDAVITSVQSQIVNLGTPCLVNGECLPTTTTTTTILDCSFTGTANQLPDPTTTTTSSSTSSTTTTTTTVPSIGPSSAEYQASPGNGCASGDYPLTYSNVPAPINFTSMFFPPVTWSDIEYVEVVTVTPVAGLSVKYNGVNVAPGSVLVPASAFAWANSMTITRDSFDCTNTVEQWTVKIKLYAYTELTNISTFSVGFVQTVCPDCTITTTTSTTLNPG